MEEECKECNESKPASAFTASRWKRADQSMVCRECIARHVSTGMPWQCMACAAWKEEAAFAEEYASPKCTFYRVCNACDKTHMCGGCQTRKPKTCFSAGAWMKARGGVRMSLDCSSEVRGFRTCSVCKARKEKKSFQTWILQHSSCFKGDQICDECSRKPLARGIVRKALDRVAATEAKVVAEKRARVLAVVREEIAARKRKREDTGSTGQAAALRQEQGSAQKVDTPKDVGDVCGTRQHGASAIETARPPAGEKEPSQDQKSVQYIYVHRVMNLSAAPSGPVR